MFSRYTIIIILIHASEQELLKIEKINHISAKNPPIMVIKIKQITTQYKKINQKLILRQYVLLGICCKSQQAKTYFGHFIKKPGQID